MKYFVFTIIALFSGLTLWAQVGMLQVAGKEDSRTYGGQFHAYNFEVPVEGTPYVNEIYKQGETLINGKIRTAALMRYDAYNDAVELLDENQRPRKLLRRKNIAANFGGKTYQVMEYSFGGATKLGYFNPLNEGEVQLLYKPKKKFVQASNPENGYDSYRPPTYKDASTYYLKVGKNAAQEIKLGKRAILKELKDQRGALKKFILEHHLDMKKEVDVLRLLEFYNSNYKTSEKAIFGGPTALSSNFKLPLTQHFS